MLPLLSTAGSNRGVTRRKSIRFDPLIWEAGKGRVECCSAKGSLRPQLAMRVSSLPL